VPPLPPLPTPTLFRLAPEHARACLDLDQAALGGIWSLAQWQRELKEEARPGLGLRQGQTLLAIACGWLVLDELHITLVAVALEQRRLGLGGRVLEALLEIARASGALRATLEVAPGNGAAVALYRRFGFRDGGLRRGYYRNGDDALIQWLQLTASKDEEPGCG